MKARRLLGSVVLAGALTLGLVATAAPMSQAKTTTKKYTMLKGETQKVQILFIGNLTSAKSSKPGVVSVKKYGGNKLKLKAKKTGKATINVRGKYGYGRYIITVKKKSLKCTYKGFNANSYGGGYAYYEITNKCGVTLSSVQLTYDILGANNNVLKTASDMSIYGFTPGAKTCLSVYISPELTSQGATAIRVKKYKINHDMMTSYTNFSSKVTVKYNKSNGAVSFKSKANKSVSVKVDIVFYDSLGNIVDVQTTSAFLYEKGKDTKTVTTSKEYSTYKIYKRAYA